MTRRGTALIVFARLPVPGRTKTRLVSAVGAEGAARLARRMLHHAICEGCSAGFDCVELCLTPDDADPASASLTLPDIVVLTRQGSGDLGARMHRALARALARHERALLIGTDAPALDAILLNRAAASLDAHDAVFVPAQDGGYVLVGLRRDVPEVFRDIAWSTSEVMAQTRTRARDCGLAVAELDPVPDVDRPEDLVHLPPHWLTDVPSPAVDGIPRRR